MMDDVNHNKETILCDIVSRFIQDLNRNVSYVDVRRAKNSVKIMSKTHINMQPMFMQNYALTYLMFDILHHVFVQTRDFNLIS